MAGLAGECFLAPVCTWLAFADLGTVWRRYRLFLVGWSSTALGKGLLLWIAVTLGHSELPHGALLGEEMGDTNRLMSEYNWTPRGLTLLFTGNAFLSTWLLFVILLLEYLRFANSRRDTSQPEA